MSEPTSATLLLRLRDSADAEAWRRFVDLYTPLLYHWAGRSGIQAADAAELIQEVFVVLLRSLPAFRYDPGRSFRAWLHTLVRTKWIDMQRKRSHPAVDAGLSGVAAGDDLVELEETEFRNFLIQRALQLAEEEFGASTVQAFRAAALEDRPAAEVASRLGITENAVYLARRRVMQRLKESLDGMWD
jgi:RNA polymerase sigma-70 factor (ECF subfamily)